MENQSKSTPRDVFLHLLAIVLLYIGIFSLIALLWQYVDVLRPDQLKNLGGYSNASSVVKSSISSLLVVWPVFILVNWLIKKEEAKETGKRDIKVKKWLLYLTLFVAALTMIIDLIMLINNFLDGSLTLNFFLKVLVVLVVAAAVFWYYLWDLKQAVGSQMNLPKIFAWLSSAVIVIAIIAGFFVMGSPQEQRARRFDQQRVQDLQMLQAEVISYWQAKDMLPENLGQLENGVTGFTPPTDPTTDAAYEYHVKGDLQFELCANFEKPSDSKYEGMSGPNYYGETNWEHQTGQTCFDRTIDPDFYDTMTPKAEIMPSPR